MCSNCAGDYEDPDMTTETEELDLAKCKLRRLDVYMFANRPEGEKLRDVTLDMLRTQGREVHTFSENVHGFVLLCVAAGPRPQSGQIARDMKKRKTVRQFIEEQ